MNKKIDVQIYGYWDKLLTSCCNSEGECINSKGGGCSGCSSGKKCCKENKGILIISNDINTVGKLYARVSKELMSSDIGNYIKLEFIDLKTINILDYDDIRVLDEYGFEPPFTVIDGIVRYYGGISKDLIYKDVMELL